MTVTSPAAFVFLPMHTGPHKPILILRLLSCTSLQEWLCKASVEEGLHNVCKGARIACLLICRIGGTRVSGDKSYSSSEQDSEKARCPALLHPCAVNIQRGIPTEECLITGGWTIIWAGGPFRELH